jgi:hypothetical protein
MPLPAEILEDLGRKRSEESRLANRDKRRELVLAALLCWFWAGAGLLCIAWSMHTTVPWLGKAAFWAGLAIGNAGILFTLLYVYRRGERRGDW